MSDRVFLATAVLIAAVLIVMSFVWPQGFGRPAPAPFGKPEVMSAAAQADLALAAKTAAAKKAGPKPAPAVSK
jgi:hypothetical protein